MLAKNTFGQKKCWEECADELARVIFDETKMECNFNFSSRGYFQNDSWFQMRVQNVKLK